MKQIRTFLLAGCALAASSALAQAQFATSGDVISFGDSLSDNGNAAALTAGGLGVPLSTVSVNGFPPPSTRFVNPGGLTWIEQLLGGTPDPTGAPAVSPQNSPFQGTGVTGNVNAAVGGALAGSGNLNAALGVGVTEQIGAFAASGGTIDADDTVTYWAGANNFFAGLPTVASAADAAALGQGVAALAINDITQLATGAVVPGGGPGQLVYVNLPDLGTLPSTLAAAEGAGAAAAAATAAAGGDAAAQATAAATASGSVIGAASFATDNYNLGLEVGVAQLAAVDTNTDFVLIDVASVFDEITANPTAFGFTNVTVGCVLDPVCAAADFETQNEFLFSDGVHPSNAGYALVAELARQTLDPTIGASDAAAIADLSSSTRQHVAGGAIDRARTFFFRDAPDGVASSADVDTFSETSKVRGEVFAEVLGGVVSIGARSGTPQSDIDLIGVRFGADFLRTENLVIGIQGAYVQGNGSQPALEFESNAISLDVYAAGKIGNAFAALSVGGARSEIEDIERSVGIGPLFNTGETTSTQFSAIGELGYDYKFRGLSIIPSVTFGYFRTDLDAYTETGVFAPLAFGDRTINAVTGAFNLRAAKTFGTDEGLSGVVYAGVGYEDFLAYNAEAVTAGAVASTAAASALQVGDPEGRGFLFDIGTKVNVTRNFAIGAEYRLGIGGNDTSSHQGSLRLSARF